MKWDWSKILIVAMSLFILMIVWMGIKMSSSSSQLYEENYYEQGEAHDARMEKEQYAGNVKISHQHQVGTITISFDSIGSYGQLVFRNLSEAENDFMIKGDSVSKKDQILDVSKLEKGVWLLECEGWVNGKAFFKKYEFVR